MSEIEKLAEMSRISLSPEEKTTLQKEIGSILDYVKQVQGATSDSGDTSVIAPESRAKKLVNTVMRPDTTAKKGGECTAYILANAPRKKDGYIQVKKIVG